MKGVSGLAIVLAAMVVVVSSFGAGTPLGNGDVPAEWIPVIPNCGELMSEPWQLTLTCGSGEYSLTGIAWTGWGNRTAVGTGNAQTRDCSPDCVTGPNDQFPVVATASGRKACLNGQRQYTRLVLTYPGARPPRIGRPDTWTFPCDPTGAGPTLTATPTSVLKIVLVGAGWPRLATAAKTCERRVRLSGRNTIRGVPDQPLTKGGRFRIVWTARSPGRTVVSATQYCHSPAAGPFHPESGVYQVSVAVDARN